MLEYKQKRNNGRTPFAGVYKFVCVCVYKRARHLNVIRYIIGNVGKTASKSMLTLFH